jgi:hypothetical protein
VETTRQRHRLISIVGIALIAALMLAAFARLGGLGIEPRIATANAAAATTITSISVSPTCGSNGGFTGSVNLNGTFTGTITVGVFYHVPGDSTWFYSGVSGPATFNGTSSATYNLASYTNPAANSYRIQILDDGGLNGGATKSASVPGCSPSTTTTITTTSTASS